MEGPYGIMEQYTSTQYYIVLWRMNLGLSQILLPGERHDAKRAECEQSTVQCIERGEEKRRGGGCPNRKLNLFASLGAFAIAFLLLFS